MVNSLSKTITNLLNSGTITYQILSQGPMIAKECHEATSKGQDRNKLYNE